MIITEGSVGGGHHIFKGKGTMLLFKDRSKFWLPMCPFLQLGTSRIIVALRITYAGSQHPQPMTAQSTQMPQNLCWIVPHDTEQDKSRKELVLGGLLYQTHSGDVWWMGHGARAGNGKCFGIYMSATRAQLVPSLWKKRIEVMKPDTSLDEQY